MTRIAELRVLKSLLLDQPEQAKKVLHTFSPGQLVLFLDRVDYLYNLIHAEMRERAKEIDA